MASGGWFGLHPATARPWAYAFVKKCYEKWGRIFCGSVPADGVAALAQDAASIARPRALEGAPSADAVDVINKIAISAYWVWSKAIFH